MLDPCWFGITPSLVVSRGACWLPKNQGFARFLQRRGPKAIYNLEGLFLPILSSSPAGNAQNLQAETGGSHQLADGLQQLHTPAEEDTKGSEAQPATVTGDLEGGGGRDGMFLLPKGLKCLDF